MKPARSSCVYCRGMLTPLSAKIQSDELFSSDVVFCFFWLYGKCVLVLRRLGAEGVSIDIEKTIFFTPPLRYTKVLFY